MNRRKFLKLLGLAPVLGVIAAKVGLPDSEPEDSEGAVVTTVKAAVEAKDTYIFTDNYAQVVMTTMSGSGLNYTYDANGMYWRVTVPNATDTTIPDSAQRWGD